MKGLSKVQEKILEDIENYWAEFGYSPSLEDIRERLEFRHRTSVHKAVMALRKKGYLLDIPKHKRMLVPIIRQQGREKLQEVIEVLNKESMSLRPSTTNLSICVENLELILRRCF